MDKYEKKDCFPLPVPDGTNVYTKGDLLIMISNPHHNVGWHMSISLPFRNPTWEEIRDAWYDLVPGATKMNAAMFLPPKDEYVNVYEYCFHVHQVPLDFKMSL